MTREEIIKMAREAGLSEGHAHGMSLFLKAFAELVAEREREACAKYVEECSLPDAYSEACLPEIANEIRARGNT